MNHANEKVAVFDVVSQVNMRLQFGTPLNSTHCKIAGSPLNSTHCKIAGSPLNSTRRQMAGWF